MKKREIKEKEKKKYSPSINDISADVVPREWLPVKISTSQFKVLSYNLLADSLVNFRKDMKLCFSFDNRYPKIKAELLHSNADVVVLQECD